MPLHLNMHAAIESESLHGYVALNMQESFGQRCWQPMLESSLPP